MKPLVLHIRASNFVGGPEKQIIGHIRSSIRYRHAVVTFLEGSGANPFYHACMEQGIPVGAVRSAGPWDLGGIVRLRRAVNRMKPGVICTHGYKPAAMAVAGMLGRRYPILAFSRGETAESKRVTLYEWIEHKALRAADRIICVSESQKERVARKGAKAERCRVVRNAVSESDFWPERQSQRGGLRTQLGIAENAALVVAAGRLSPEKGHRYLIEAMALMKDSGQEVVSAFCGDGACRGELAALAERRGVAGLCRFLGFRHDIPEIFHAMDLLVLPSLTEGLPNVVLEAFACAKAVVATAVGGVPEVVEHGVNGLLVPPARPDLLAEAIHNCLRNPDKLRAMGMRGREKVAADFSFEKQTRQLEAIYEEVLTAR